MRALLDEKIVGKFNSKELYSKVVKLFDEYNAKQLSIQNIAVQSMTHSVFDEYYKSNRKSDPVWNATVRSEKLVDYVIWFEHKIKYLKTQFTEDEEIIFHLSLEERELDKIIMEHICKSEHKYYQIKKSCYLKIALCFNLITPKFNDFDKEEIAQGI